MHAPPDDPVHALALEARALLTELDRSRFQWGAHAASRRAQLDALRAHLGRAVADASRPDGAALAALRADVEAHAPIGDTRPAWIEFRRRIVPSFEALATVLRADGRHVPRLRQKNYVRNAYHLASAMSSLALLELAPSWRVIHAVAWGLAIAAWTLESTRRLSPRLNTALMTLFGPVAHAHEAHRVNSGTWYVTATAVLSLTNDPLCCALALTTLGFGDPAAAIVGRRWGRRAWRNGRTVEGFAAFVFAATIPGALVAAELHGLALVPSLAVAGTASIAGAYAELHSRRVDDNLSIPVLAWIGAAIASAVLGISS